MAKTGATKSPYKKPQWVSAVDNRRRRDFSKVRLVLAGLLAAFILLFMGYQIFFAPKVKSPGEAATMAMAQKRSDGKIFDQWVRERMARLCEMGAGDDISFTTRIVRPPQSAYGDRYDISVVPAMANNNLPAGCPERQPLASVYAEDGTIVPTGENLAPAPKFAGPTLPVKFWLTQFLNGEKP